MHVSLVHRLLNDVIDHFRDGREAQQQVSCRLHRCSPLPSVLYSCGVPRTLRESWDDCCKLEPDTASRQLLLLVVCQFGCRCSIVIGGVLLINNNSVSLSQSTFWRCDRVLCSVCTLTVGRRESTGSHHGYDTLAFTYWADTMGIAFAVFSPNSNSPCSLRHFKTVLAARPVERSSNNRVFGIRGSSTFVGGSQHQSEWQWVCRGTVSGVESV